MRQSRRRPTTRMNAAPLPRTWPVTVFEKTGQALPDRTGGRYGARTTRCPTGPADRLDRWKKTDPATVAG